MTSQDRSPDSFVNCKSRNASIKLWRVVNDLSPLVLVTILIIQICPSIARAEQILQSYFGVRVEKTVEAGKLYSQGSGVLLGDGLVITAAHVVKYNHSDPNVTILVENQRVRGRVVAEETDNGTDLALIEIQPQALPARSRGVRATLCDHDPGPDRSVIVASLGEITRSKTVVAPDQPATGRDWTTTLGTGYHHGSSGGGVFDAEEGCLLGIITIEISGRIRPSDPFIDETRFTPAPAVSRLISKYRTQTHQEWPAEMPDYRRP